MNKCSFTGFIVLALVGSTAAAADGGWTMPNLNPFAAKSKTPASARSHAATSGWHMPSLWPAPTTAKRKSNQPSTWSKMTTGTKSFFSKTADALTPGDSSKTNSAPKITGSNSIFSHQAPKKEEKSSSILPTSWWTSDKTDEPKSVNEFLARPRPQ